MSRSRHIFAMRLNCSVKIQQPVIFSAVLALHPHKTVSTEWHRSTEVWWESN